MTCEYRNAPECDDHMVSSKMCRACYNVRQATRYKLYRRQNPSKVGKAEPKMTIGEMIAKHKNTWHTKAWV